MHIFGAVRPFVTAKSYRDRIISPPSEKSVKIAPKATILQYVFRPDVTEDRFKKGNTNKKGKKGEKKDRHQSESKE
jgi:hypothetical protein